MRVPDGRGLYLFIKMSNRLRTQQTSRGKLGRDYEHSFRDCVVCYSLGESILSDK